MPDGQSDRVIVARGHTGSWHHPAPDATDDKPAPECESRHGTDPNWRWMDRDEATAWNDECAYCSGSYDPGAVDQDQSWPVDTSTEADD
jgi:hypothetical protein